MKLTAEKLKQIVKEELAEMSAKNAAPAVATKDAVKEAEQTVTDPQLLAFYILKQGVIGVRFQLGRLLEDLKFLDNEQTKNKIQNILKTLDDISPK